MTKARCLAYFIRQSCSNSTQAVCMFCQHILSQKHLKCFYCSISSWHASEKTPSFLCALVDIGMPTRAGNSSARKGEVMEQEKMGQEWTDQALEGERLVSPVCAIGALLLDLIHLHWSTWTCASNIVSSVDSLWLLVLTSGQVSPGQRQPHLSFYVEETSSIKIPYGMRGSLHWCYSITVPGLAGPLRSSISGFGVLPEGKSPFPTRKLPAAAVGPQDVAVDALVLLHLEEALPLQLGF